MGDWVEELCGLFQKETNLYKQLLDIENKKKEAITKADGKLLEELTKSTYNLLVSASEIERIRMKTIEQVYEKEKLKKESQGITLTDFLNKIDRENNFRLKSFATELKTTVHKLKESVILNEKLIQTRQELLKKTIMEMQDMEPRSTYEPRYTGRSSAKSSRSLVLDASV